MPEYQTTVKNDFSQLRGSGKVEVSRYKATPTWLNVGAINSLVIEEETTIAAEENQNTDADDKITKQRIKVSFDQMEFLDLDVWEVLRDEQDNIVQNSNSTTIQSGNKSTLNDFMVRITTKNDGNPFYFIGYKGNLLKGFNFVFKKDDDDDRRTMNPIEMTFKPDPTYHPDADGNGYVYEIEADFQG